MKTTNKTPNKIKEYKVVFFADGSEIGTRVIQATKQQLWKKLKNWIAVERDNGREHPHFEITEVVHYKPLTSLFLDKDKITAVGNLLKDVKALVKSYDKEDCKFGRARRMAVDMWNSLQNEFYMSANICDNTVWKWQDAVKDFDKTGYLFDREPCELTEWTKYLTGLYIRDWAFEILNLIKDFNLDNQEPAYVSNFQHDFMSVKNKEQFYSTVLKWTDLVYWSPWKLEFLKNSVPQPLNMHWDDDFNEDVFDSFNQEEV